MSTVTKNPANCDVFVAGGGLAGLTAALQLKQMRPKTSIAVVEKRSLPVPEVAFKVGESAAEIGSHYLKESIGFKRHMEEEQIRKFSLRIFSSAGANSDISRRPEIGLSRFSPLRTYQLDRGKLENALAEAASNLGVEVIDEHTVTALELGPDRHRVTVKRNGSTRDFSPRWIVDASGRAGLLRRRLGLGVDIDHDVNASWFRVGKRIVVDQWSDDPAWHARVPSGKRWMSTVQLVGEGYWLWVIPLPSEATSIGIVADPRFVPYERIRRYEALYEWLRENEPQLASELPASESGLLDFRKLKKYAYGTRRGLSPQRWALTGEAGLFLDPLYSTGLDFIAVANTLTTRLIAGALDEEPDFRRRLKAYNAFYLGQFLGWEPAFRGQYEIFRDAQATAAKVIWDNAFYFMFPVLLFTKDCITDLDFLASIRKQLADTHPLNVHMQQGFREVSKLDVRSAGFPVASDRGVEDLFEISSQSMSKDEVRERITRGVDKMSWLAHEFSERLFEPAGIELSAPPCARPTDSASGGFVTWVPYSQRTTSPAETQPQPADSWMIR
ncbi:MAG TPA: tryptophan 7-halogenase [Solirubrobacterales bacterium]